MNNQYDGQNDGPIISLESLTLLEEHVNSVVNMVEELKAENASLKETFFNSQTHCVQRIDKMLAQLQGVIGSPR